MSRPTDVSNPEQDETEKEENAIKAASLLLSLNVSQ